ncbi:phosphoglycerate mutase-like protein [Cucurbitaria berberidis CBS 394.84]|uniref:Phosphoglycerate mutase-like protein n=1 Tax=Cucurbitaria berberidis CBS 394.84 TaxID=1168544 RepID=A0A9P4G9P1_9PLEO|nr:phosphoglycerate mutase-like protein [Cucurbitaria berberidis CBS 394.84]KAF1841544.1 phosphoglycerate mutase-like protein [Cucurbitaria berberidis CBS 394.84]
MIASSLLYGLLAAASTATAYSPAKYTNYTVVKGIFQQDDDATNPSTFNFTASNFGLIPRSYPSDDSYPDSKQSTQWQRLAHYIDTLNKKTKRKERYTLFFMGRHGEGYHNAAETYFGTPAWNCYWSELDGNSTVTWADAHLTEQGVVQAKRVNTFWKHLIKDEKISPPEKYYSSPLYRCLDTARLTFADLDLPHKNRFQPIIKENLREGVSAHTCDRRSSKTYIKKNFPEFKFESGFAKEDPYWQELHSEPRANQDARSKEVIDEIFSQDDESYISISSHSGEIASLLRVLGHRVFSLSTGSVIPVLVKADLVIGDAPATTTLPYAAQKTCTAPPTIRDSSCNDCSCCL